MPNKTRRDEYSGGFPDGFEPFEELDDPRWGRHPRHYFGEIIFIALAAMICGSEGFEDFERFAKARESWLRKRLKLPGGLPSDDTFRRVFTAIDPDKFCECFASFVLALGGKLRRQLIAIDGKCWMSPSTKTNAGLARATRPRISPCCAKSACPCSSRTPASRTACVANATGPHSTKPSSRASCSRRAQSEVTLLEIQNPLQRCLQIPEGFCLDRRSTRVG